MSSRNTKNLLSSFSSYSSSSLKTMHSDAISAILITTDGRFLRCNQATQRSSRRCPEEGRSGDFWKDESRALRILEARHGFTQERKAECVQNANLLSRGVHE